LDLGDRYHQPKPFEHGGRLYVRLGVRYFKLVAPYGDLMNRIMRFFRPDFRIIKNPASLQAWLETTRSKEAGHIVHTMMVLPALIFVLARRWYASAATLLLLTVLFDMYPVMLQRYNRFRLKKTHPARIQANRHAGL
jgi:hypothetical protein